MAAREKKSYQAFLAEIPDQVRRASDNLSTTLVERLKETVSTGAILVGSGGSLTSAHFYAQVIERLSRKQCTVYTPLELLHSSLDLRGLHCFFFSAEGKNPDIIHAFKYADKNHALVTCITNFEETPLGKLCEQTNQTHICLPVNEKDGFLALSTIVSTITSGYVAYGTFNHGSENHNPNDIANVCTSSCTILNETNHLVVVYAPALKPAAVDIESRFHESGVAMVQIADMRNFSHGRHYGAYLNEHETHIMILSDERTIGLARSTRLAINESLSNSLIVFSGSPVEAMFQSVLFSMQLLWDAAQRFNRDPNRVRVPQFGRALYYLPYQSQSLEPSGIQPRAPNLPRHYFNTQFDTVVFDYDGTLCDSKERFDNLKPIVALMLERYLNHGVRVGIATGRGKSAGIAIRQALDKKWWHSVIIGYYNGSIIETADKILDTDQYQTDQIIKHAHDFIESEKLENVTVELRPTQVTIEFESTSHTESNIDTVCEKLMKYCPDTKVLRSSHSIDVINKSTSKLHVIDAMDSAMHCLAVGDSGQPGGNDHELLSHPFGISVNHATGHPSRGIKIGDPDEIELSATLRLFSLVQFGQGFFTLKDEAV